MRICTLEYWYCVNNSGGPNLRKLLKKEITAAYEQTKKDLGEGHFNRPQKVEVQYTDAFDLACKLQDNPPEDKGPVYNINIKPRAPKVDINDEIQKVLHLMTKISDSSYTFSAKELEPYKEFISFQQDSNGNVNNVEMTDEGVKFWNQHKTSDYSL